MSNEIIFNMIYINPDSAFPPYLPQILYSASLAYLKIKLLYFWVPGKLHPILLNREHLANVKSYDFSMFCRYSLRDLLETHIHIENVDNLYVYLKQYCRAAITLFSPLKFLINTLLSSWEISRIIYKTV